MSIVHWPPLLLLLAMALPLWWHRQRRRNPNSQLFAAAQFLPAVSPQQKRIWRWQYWLLLIMRLLLIAVLAALLADISLPFRQKTTLISQARAAQLREPDGLIFCAQTAPECDIVSDDIWLWLARHEREWSPEKMITLEAFADELPMPSQRPHYAHTLRIVTEQREGDVSAPPLVATSSDELPSTLNNSRVWPSAALRDYLILLLIIGLLAERALQHVNRR
jgi:hypothetical protein